MKVEVYKIFRSSGKVAKAPLHVFEDTTFEEAQVQFKEFEKKGWEYRFIAIGEDSDEIALPKEVEKSERKVSPKEPEEPEVEIAPRGKITRPAPVPKVIKAITSTRKLLAPRQRFRVFVNRTQGRQDNAIHTVLAKTEEEAIEKVLNDPYEKFAESVICDVRECGEGELIPSEFPKAKRKYAHFKAKVTHTRKPRKK